VPRRPGRQTPSMNLGAPWPAAVPRPRDYLETIDGLHFAVVSSLLDAGHALTNLRYVRRDGALIKLSTSEADASDIVMLPVESTGSFRAKPRSATGAHHGRAASRQRSKPEQRATGKLITLQDELSVHEQRRDARSCVGGRASGILRKNLHARE